MRDVAEILEHWQAGEKPASAPSPAPTQTPALTPSTVITPIPTPAPVGVSVSIQGFAFVPASITVNKGTTVTWINRDAARHTVTGANFDSGSLSQGQSFSFIFNVTGTFSYLCSFHSSMRGEVIVR